MTITVDPKQQAVAQLTENWRETILAASAKNINLNERNTYTIAAGGPLPDIEFVETAQMWEGDAAVGLTIHNPPRKINRIKVMGRDVWSSTGVVSVPFMMNGTPDEMPLSLVRGPWVADIHLFLHNLYKQFEAEKEADRQKSNQWLLDRDIAFQQEVDRMRDQYRSTSPMQVPCDTEPTEA